MLVSADYVFRALDQVAAEVTRTFLVAREHHMQRGTRARARLVHALISDTFDSELSLQKQAVALNITLAPGYVAALTQGERERAGEALVEIAAAGELPGRALTHAIDPQTMVLLWPADSPDGAAQAASAVSRLQVEAEGRWGKARGRLRAGLGGYHAGLHGASRSYVEAQRAIDIGRRLRPDETLHDYADLVPYLLLAQAPLAVERFVQHHLGKLLEADQKGRTPLLETLEAYLRRGSVKEAAAALRLHRHTVLYRLDKVRELLDVDLDEPRARLRLQLAADLRHLL
jgi:purine catabolism regulator